MPRVLSERDIESFRQQLCDVATRRFAEDGYEGVTLRGLAQHLGCSPMTPYRYFRNKEEIFTAVRAAAFARFGERVRAAYDPRLPPAELLRQLAHTYVGFALDEAHASRIMFELTQPEEPEMTESELESWQPLLEAMRAATRAGVLEGDPETLAHLCWANLHGIITLHLAGKLKLGRSIEDLVEASLDHFLRGRASVGESK